MSKNTHFDFIDNKILRKNLDIVFEHILTLIPFTESNDYNEQAKSSFRKTIIIHTASIVEALLFSVLNKKFSDQNIKDHYSYWKIKGKKVLHTVEKDKLEIVAGNYSKEVGKTTKEKMNLGQIVDFLKEKEVVDTNIYKKVDKLRNLRNEQHIGSHKTIKSYTKANLDEAFKIARTVKELISNL